MGWIQTRFLKDNVITSGKLAAGAVDATALGAGSITTAKLADGALSANAIGRAKMADGFISADAAGRAKIANSAITTAKIDDIILQYQDVTIPGGSGAGKVGNLFSSPVEIIPAQGAGTIIVPIDFTVAFIGGTAAYNNAGAGDDIAFNYTGGTDVIDADIDNGNGAAVRLARVGAGTDYSCIKASNAAELVPVANTGISVYVRTADPFTAAGDVSMRIVATYRVVSFA